MEPSHFDTLTRSLTAACPRRGVLVTIMGGALGLLGLGRGDESRARRRHHARIPPCRKLKARCKPKGDRYRCCDKINRLHCDKVGATGFRCCYNAQQVCSGAESECCRDLTCGTVPALPGARCCARTGASCGRHNDCCDGALCLGGVLGVGVCGDAPTCVASGQPCPDGCRPNEVCPGCCTGACTGGAVCGMFT